MEVAVTRQDTVNSNYLGKMCMCVGGGATNRRQRDTGGEIVLLSRRRQRVWKQDPMVPACFDVHIGDHHHGLFDTCNLMSRNSRVRTDLRGKRTLTHQNM